MKTIRKKSTAKKVPSRKDGIDLSEMEQGLRLLHDKLRREKKDEWNRVLPLEELIFDRWEKARFVKAKKGSSIYHMSYVFGNVQIGRNTWVGPFTVLDGSGGKLSIGDFCSISTGVQIYTHNTVDWAVSGGKAPYEKKDTTVGSCCYIGPYSVVAMGSKIGKCSIIGSHSLVSSDIPPYSIAFGTPARVVGRLEIRGRTVKKIYFKKEKKSPGH